ncbi:MAG: hypothetical protein PWQ37_48 [Candidatus Petromonas sp.]|jgi:hypothetical protein|nr:hypothetical protein [Candidatus Petromonas sp.]
MFKKVKRTEVIDDKETKIYSEFTDKDILAFNEVNPESMSMKIAIIYGVVGVLWILLSDEILSFFTDNIQTFKSI